MGRLHISYSSFKGYRMKSALLAPTQTKPSNIANADLQLVDRIRRLSVEAIIAGVSVCTACGESTGHYIITYNGSRFDYDALETCVFLETIVSLSD